MKMLIAKYPTAIAAQKIKAFFKLPTLRYLAIKKKINWEIKILDKGQFIKLKDFQDWTTSLEKQVRQAIIFQWLLGLPLKGENSFRIFIKDSPEEEWLQEDIEPAVVSVKELEKDYSKSELTVKLIDNWFAGRWELVVKEAKRIFKKQDLRGITENILQEHDPEQISWGREIDMRLTQLLTEF